MGHPIPEEVARRVTLTGPKVPFSYVSRRIHVFRGATRKVLAYCEFRYAKQISAIVEWDLLKLAGWEQ